MVRFLIASHGRFAEGLYDTFVMVMGKRDGLSFFGAYTDIRTDQRGRRESRPFCLQLHGYETR